MSFNAPPNWPTPPPGWQPDPDWKPDPSWPPAPPGWEFWADPDIDTDTARLATPSANAPAVVAEVSEDPETKRFAMRGGLGGPYRRFIAVARTALQPARLGFAAMAVAGLVIFSWIFVELRFDPQWTYNGWLWRGVWPVTAMAFALAVGFAGILGTQHYRGASRP